MIYVVAGLAIIVFMVAFAILHIVSVAKCAINTSRDVAKTLSDPALDDAYREQALQQASLSLLGNFISITWRGATALGSSYLVIYIADAAGLVNLQEILDLLSSWEALLSTTVVLTIAWLIWKKWWT